MRLKLLQKKKIQKTAETMGDLIDNKIADKIKATKTRERYTSLAKRQQIITDLQLI